MNILHVDTERGWRGGERQVLWLATELQRRGHGTAVASRPSEPLAEKSRAAGLRVVPCAPLFEADPIAALRLRGTIVREQVSIVHAHTGHAVGLGALAVSGTPARLVVARRVDFRLRDNAVTRWKYRRAAAVIAISGAVAQALKASNVPESNITVVPDGADLGRMVSPALPSLLEAIGVPPNAPLAVQVAQLVPHKDPLNFVRAIAEARRSIPALHAILAGDGPLRDAVEQEVQRLGLRDALHVLGYRADAESLMASADVCVLSSREEGMGSVLLDALFLGKPIAATRAGGIPEIVEDGVSGLLAPVEDPVALGGAITLILSDASLAERLRAAGRRRVREFSVERMTDRTIEVYERVLARPERTVS